MGLLDFFMEPFDKERHESKDVGLGGQSTEYLATERAPDGGFWNIPMIWYSPDGKPVKVGIDQAYQMAVEHEKRTGQRFPRYDSPGAGSFSAMNRSAMGGGQNGLLTDWGRR